MPRGSRPGERRGGRQKGTPNKKTLLKNAAIAVAAANSNLSPLEFLLNLMRQENLPLEFRVAVAQQALPLAHPRPKAQNGVHNRNGQSQSNVKAEIGPRVEVRKVDRDDAGGGDAHILPLDFLLGVMRDPNNPPGLRLRAAAIVAPFVHAKGEPYRMDEPPGLMTVVDDPYGFDADLADRLGPIHQDQKRLNAFASIEDYPDLPERVAAYEKAQETPAYLELEKSIADKQAAFPCPPTYKEADNKQDCARLEELASESKKRPLTAAEEIEQRHLRARVEVYSWGPESYESKLKDFIKTHSWRRTSSRKG